MIRLQRDKMRKLGKFGCKKYQKRDQKIIFEWKKEKEEKCSETYL